MNQMYKVMDGNGRVYVPKVLRTATGMDAGGIIKLSLNSSGGISVSRVNIVEVGDQSPEAVEAFVKTAIHEMPDEKRIGLIAELTELLKHSRKAGK